MNTLLIISIIVTVIALGMYWKAKKEVITVEKDRDYWMERQSDEEKINLFNSAEIEKLRTEFNSQSDELEKEKEKSKNLIWLIDTQHKPDIQKLREELANLQQLAVTELSHDPKLFDPIKKEEFDLEFRTVVDWTSIEISLLDLIGDDKLFEVFTSLIQSKLLPETIQNSIDYQKGSGQVVIWTQGFDSEGNPISSFTWKEITQQIILKKEIVISYLEQVIQASDRAMVVHKARR